jgi:hypothetical protein
VQIATSPTGNAQFGWDNSLAQISVSTSNVVPGSLVSEIVGPLTSGVTYYFAVWYGDEVGNWSSVSNIASAYASLALPITFGTISGNMSYSGSFTGVYKVAIATAIGEGVSSMNFVTPITSFSGAGYYSFSGLQLPNTFYVVGIIDANGNDSPDGYEPIGYFKTEPDFSAKIWNAAPIYLGVSSQSASNINFSFMDFSAISGRIVNNSEQVGNLVIIASHSVAGENSYNFTESTFSALSWDYNLRVPADNYKITAFVDVNGNRLLDSNEYFAAASA